jgi:hypothetical protein
MRRTAFKNRRARQVVVVGLLLATAIVLAAVRATGAVHAAPRFEKAKQPRVILVRPERTAPLRDLAARKAPSGEKGEAADAPFINAVLPGFPSTSDDPAVQTTTKGSSPAPIGSFDGIAYATGSCNCAPPDTNAEVGKTQIVQMVNTGIAVYSKTGTQLLPTTAIGKLWPLSQPTCQLNRGDPVVLYDQLADRWLISQFAFADPTGNSGPYDECVAVSQTGDATGAWFTYDFTMSNTLFPDYPKLGLWYDGSANKSSYMMSLNTFGTFGYAGAGAVAFQRAEMLAGHATHVVIFDVNTAGGSFLASHFGQLPADLSGSQPAPAGEAAPFVESNDFANTLPIFRFAVDWTNPAAATFAADPAIAVNAFSSDLCSASRGECVPQSGTTNTLESLSDRLMFRADYRNAGGTEHLLATQTVNSAGSGTASGAIRWYDLTKNSGLATTFAVGQQSTYAPDATYRFMPSIAADGIGDVAVGYSGSSASIHPDIRYAGRLWNDTPSTLEAEQVLFAGGGSQTGTLHRWGDYSDLSVDPDDNCTFWYATEYIPVDGSFNWHTRLGRFQFPDCVFGLSSLTPSTGAAGSTVTINGSGFAKGATNVIFSGGAAAPTVNVISPHQLQAVVPGNAVTGPITVTSPTGSDSTASFTDTSASITGIAPSSGAVGTAVTVTGAHLTGASAVKFAGVAATYTVSSDSAIATSVPAGASSGKISVATPAGTATSTDSFTVPSPPPPPAPPPPPPASPPPPPPPPPSCVVPSVLGLTVAGAQGALTAAHCSLGTARLAFSSAVAAGRVISQGAAAGSTLANGAAVDLVVSKGKAPKKPPARVTLCYRHHTVHVTKAAAKKLRKHGATAGACRKTKKK